MNVLLKPRRMFWLQGVKTSTTFNACSSIFVKPLPLKKNLIRESSSKHESAHCFQWLRSLKVTSGRHVVSKQFLVSNPPRPDIPRSATGKISLARVSSHNSHVQSKCYPLHSVYYIAKKSFQKKISYDCKP